jgi:hypothetical protein
MTAEQQQRMTEQGAATRDRSTGRACLNVPVSYVFTQTLAANETRFDLFQQVRKDFDFFLRGWQLTEPLNTSVLGRFRLQDGYYFAAGLYPLILDPLRSITSEIRIPGGGQIGIELTNTTGAPVRVRFVFHGVTRRFVD